MSNALIGLEVIKLDEHDPRAPWRMTVDLYRDGKVYRYQVTGKHHEKHERTLEEVARVQFGSNEDRMAAAERLHELDCEYGKQIAELVRQLQREQIRVLHGDSGVELFDQEP